MMWASRSWCLALRISALIPRFSSSRLTRSVLDGDGADQDRLAAVVTLGDLVDQGLELGLLGLVDDVPVLAGSSACWSD